ncbi:MAG: two pore domain potassium channel family protein [Chloroflexi bacterium]|nr:two pore domain potassium channel family protein [Chloroflexota bacterium]
MPQRVISPKTARRLMRNMLETNKVAHAGLRWLLLIPVFVIVLALLLALTLTGTVGFRVVDPNADWIDCLYMAVITLTTVGYGDTFPVTTAGRAVAFVLMIGGIGFFGAITANFASFLIKEPGVSQTNSAQIIGEIEILRTEISRLRESLSQTEPP